MSTAMPDGSFSIVSLRGHPLSRSTLDGLDKRCVRMPENEKLCRRLLHRLEFLHDHVAPLQSDDPLKKKYISVVVGFVKMMRRTPLLLRLANSETIVCNIRGFQERLSDVQRGVGLGGAPEMTEWSEQWENYRSEQYDKLNERVSRATERMLVNEVRGEKKVKEAMMTLQSGLNWTGLSPEMLELKRQTATRLTTFASETGLPMFEWFIASDNIEIKESIGETGTIGEASRGIWTHDGIRTEVIVKSLFPETSADSDAAFLRQIELWSSIPENKHILKLYGGSHVSSPQFYVCENAYNGNLLQFLEKEKNSNFFWQIFFDVAQGLQFLHERGIVHGGLKCNNILVGADYSAKLTDFSFSTVRTLSAGLSGKAAEASADAVRWKPKETLEETGTADPLFKSDIYSLGMCLVEVLSKEIPFGMTDDQEVIEMILLGVMPPRPDNISNDTWNLIGKLCAADLTKRLNLKQVLNEFGVRAAEERKLNPIPRPALETSNKSQPDRVAPVPS